MPAVTAATLYGLPDCFCGVNRDWSVLHGGHAESPFRSMVVSRDGQPLRGRERRARRGGGVVRRCGSPDVVCVTDIAVPPGEPLGQRLRRRGRLAEGHATPRASSLASSCSGAVLLARTGLLEGLDATSHWAYCDALQTRPPRHALASGARPAVRGCRPAHRDGRQRHRLAPAGDGADQQLRRRRGGDAGGAHQPDRLDRGQPVRLRVASPRSQSADAVVAAAQAWAAEHYARGAGGGDGASWAAAGTHFSAASSWPPAWRLSSTSSTCAWRKPSTCWSPVSRDGGDRLRGGLPATPSFFTRLFRRKVRCRRRGSAPLRRPEVAPARGRKQPGRTLSSQRASAAAERCQPATCDRRRASSARAAPGPNRCPVEVEVEGCGRHCAATSTAAPSAAALSSSLRSVRVRPRSWSSARAAAVRSGRCRRTAPARQGIRRAGSRPRCCSRRRTPTPPPR